MKTVWIAGVILLATTGAYAQSTIYKVVDESGRITYTNKPMKGATVVELEPLTVIPNTPGAGPSPGARAAAAQAQADTKASAFERANLVVQQPSDVKPVAAIITPLPRTTVAAIEPQLQKKRDEDRRRILEAELSQEEASLTSVRTSLVKEQQNPDLVAAVRALQQAQDATPTQLAEYRQNLERHSGRIRGLQSTASEHEKNIEALKKELGALKP